MKITYDKQTDAMYILFKKGKLFDSVEVGTNLVVDQDKKGELLGLEILNASKNLGEKRQIIIGNKILHLPAYAA